MGVQTIAIILGSLALSDIHVVPTDARRLGGSMAPYPPPGPPKDGGSWVWVSGKEESSSEDDWSGDDWTGDDWVGDAHEDEDWEGDAHKEEEEVVVETKPTMPPPPPKTEAPPPPKTEAPPPPPPKTTEAPPKPKPTEPPVEETSSGYSSKIVGSAKGGGEVPVEPTPIGAYIGIAAAVAAVVAAAVLLAKKKRSANEIDPEDDDMFDEEDSQFVGEDSIPPPPPLEANNDDIEIDESFLQLDGDGEENQGLMKEDDLESI